MYIIQIMLKCSYWPKKLMKNITFLGQKPTQVEFNMTEVKLILTMNPLLHDNTMRMGYRIPL